jgi:hypothetical protein
LGELCSLPVRPVGLAALPLLPYEYPQLGAEGALWAFRKGHDNFSATRTIAAKRKSLLT